MNGLLPETASTAAARVDPLFWTITAVFAFFLVLVLALLVVFSIRYRRRDGRSTGDQIAGNVKLEIAWTAVPTAISLALFVWAGRLFVDETRPPADAATVYVVAKQWMWKLQHPQGPREIGELHVPVGRRVALLMTSEDVIHSLFIPAFRMKMDVLPGRYTTAWFEATRTGEFPFLCTEFCGTKHATMSGRVVVMEPAAFAAWIAAHAADAPLAAGGAELFRQYRCDSCHGATSTDRGPALGGLLGRRVRFADGTELVADAGYVRESILRPGVHVAAGWSNAMPSYQGRLDEEQLVQLLAYVASLPAAEDRR
jgi:cytochrome c oxidase subunit 2